ncbi:MAG: DICT sensory domain-containing protein, partial [Cyanobacteria bacterium J06639_1]
MNPPTSLFDAVLQEFSDLRPQVYFKPTLTALTQAMEDLVLSRDEQPLVILSLQREQQYRCSIRRYQQVGQRSYQTFVLAVPDDVTGFAIASDPCTTIPLNSEDALAREWHLLIVSRRYVAGAICRASTTSDLGDEFDWSERYESVWTFDAAIVTWAARWMLDRILILRPELAERVAAAKRDYRLAATAARPRRSHARQTDASAFASRLVTYLQASQYQLL